MPPLRDDAGGLPPLTRGETRRYSRHLILPDVGAEGQRRLKAAKVLLVGAGGLGSPAALYLAAAGVGTIGIVDGDRVDETNLQRQVLYGAPDVGRPKVEAAEARLRDLNPHVEVVRHEAYLTSENALDVVGDYDVVVDGADNFPTRYLVNDACVLLGKPNVHGSIFRFEGQASVFGAGDGPCYRCLYPEPPPPGLVPSCAEGGVLGVLPGIVGCVQAIEAVKLILGIGEPLVGRLLLFDALAMEFTELNLKRRPECPVCGDDPSVTELIDYEAFCGVPTTEGHEVQGADPEEAVPSITARELAERLEASANGDLVLLDVREPHEWDICSIEGALRIPLGELPGRAAGLDPAAEVVVHCRSGVRSAQAVRLLRERGFQRARNLEGGILAWARDVDPEMPTY